MAATTAIILAGGFGTRLRQVVQDLPKPMAPVRSKPFLDYQLRALAKQGIQKALLCTGHLAEKISAHYGKRFAGMQLSYSVETDPLGTGGALRQAFGECRDELVFVLNGDSLFNIDLTKFYSFHRASAADCSLALRIVPDGSRYGAIETDENNNIRRFSEKTAGGRPAIINGGVYLIGRKVFLENAPPQKTFSIEKDFFEQVAGTIRLKGFVFDDYFIDIGVPQDYERAQHEFERFEDR